MGMWPACIVAVTMLALTAQAAPAEDAVDWPAQFEAKLAELRAQGEPVTMEEVMARRAPIPDEENSALVFLQAFAAQDAVPDDVPPVSAFDVGFASEVGARQPEAVLHFLRNCVGANAEALRLIHEGARLTRGAYPITLTPNPYEILLEHLPKVKRAARLCLCEAALGAHDGDGAAAADSLFALRRLSGSLGDCVMLFDALVRMLGDEQFCDGLERTLALCELPPEKLHMLAGEIEAEAAELSLALAMRAVRAAACYWLTASAEELRTVLEDMAALPLYAGALDPDQLARDGLCCLGLMQEAIRIAALPDREKLLAAEQLEDRLRAIPPQDFVFTSILVPALGRVFKHEEVETRTRLKVTRAALAVEQWRLKNGAWPESLDALVPDLLDAVPQDPFTDGAIGYAREKAGVLLYSVGRNGYYDGGRSEQEALEGEWPDAYDLTFHLLDFSRRGTRQGDLEDESLAGGMTMLHAAAQSELWELAEWALAAGADVNARDPKGRTPLHLAAETGHREIAELLLEQGADVNAVDNQGRTPTGLATDAGHEELAEFLRRRAWGE